MAVGMNTLFKHIDCITGDSSNMLLKNVHVLVEGTKITKITTNINEIPQVKVDRVIDGHRKLMMPGLVNAHTHTPMTTLRNFADDLALEDWLFNHIFPAEAKLTPEDIYWGSMQAIVEMIKSGTTAFADMYYFVDETARAVTETGMRANLSVSAFSFTFQEGVAQFFDQTEKFRSFYKRWNDSSEGRLKSYVLVHSPYIYNRQSMTDSANFAKEIGTGIHIHIAETKKEIADTTERYGVASTEVCLQTGILDVPVIAAHCVHLTDHDIQILKNKGVSAIHNPTSNLKLASGVARVPSMISNGVNVALGTDGTASNNNLNMFEEMHLAALLHKGIEFNATVVNATEAIQMATVNGAKALGFDNVGMIQEGMKADLILLNTDQPHYYPLNHPISAVAYSTQAADVDTVMIDGKLVMQNRNLLHLDEELIRNKVTDIARRIVT